MLTFDGKLCTLERLFTFTDESQFSLYRADGRQRVWHHVGERFANVNVVDRVAHGGGGVMVWAGVCYGQQTQVHFIDGILNAQRCILCAFCAIFVRNRLFVYIEKVLDL